MYMNDQQPTYLIRTLHLAPKNASIGCMYSEVSANELGQPKGGFVVIHCVAFLGPKKPAAAICSLSRRRHDLAVAV